MAMTEQRQMEIALKIVENLIYERGIPGGKTLKREAGDLGQKIGVPTDELMSFYEAIFPKVYGRIMGYTGVGITLSGKQ